jgi:hypothetical protein
MPALKGAKTVGAPFDNTTEVVRVIYDYSVDGGQVEDNTVLTADGVLLVRCVGCIVQTAVTSGGSATIDLGKGTSGTEFVSTEAYTSFGADVFYPSESAAFVKLANGEVINMGVATAALTAGKIEFIFEVCQG